MLLFEVTSRSFYAYRPNVARHIIGSLKHLESWASDNSLVVLPDLALGTA
jgi:hypothetical protein